MSEIGRNDPCHCGSGKKYKKCHLEKDEKTDRKKREKAALNAANVKAKEGETPKKPGKPKRPDQGPGKGWLNKMANKVNVFKNFSQRKIGS